jgi:carboxymethylenebutenolidase
LAGLFAEHLHLEFVEKDAHATMKTMVDEPYVNHIPTRTGGVGHDLLKRFYKYHFIPTQPDNRQNTLISETVGADTVVLEILVRFTHDKKMDHMIPGVEPTGKRVELPVVVVASFRGDKLYNEHIYWDQASLLTQIGALEQGDLPISGAVAAHKLEDMSLPSNELMPNWSDSEGLPLSVGPTP